jgi:chromatin segregation and condensation protein Rec8/ScpA/Scc1 (kleisin family)
LAVLELAKQKELFFEQEELFSEIHLTTNKWYEESYSHY